MGVKGLWKLLEPVGRRVDLATLRGTIVAVDASIWLVQFVKAMRGPDGEALPAAHLLGTFRRVLRLLFFRIRPVFVFDGGTTPLKRRTVLLRAPRRATHDAQHSALLRRIVLNAALRSRSG